MYILRTMVMGVSLGCVLMAQAGDPVQWRVQDGGNGHWYRFTASTEVPGGPNFDQQDVLCNALGGSMVAITSAAEWEFLKTRAPTDGAYWIGLRSAQGCNWSWVTAEPVGYTAWGSSACGAGPYPNNCGSSNLRGSIANRFDCGWNWDDYPQGLVNFTDYIIEWSADCNSDGIVDFGQCRDGSLSDYNGNNVPDCCEAGERCTVGSYAVQWREEDGGNGHWYKAVRAASVISWSSSRVAAELRGGHLATFGQSTEFDMVAGRFKARTELWVQTNWARGPWIGAFQNTSAPDFLEPTGGWYWTDGRSVEPAFLATYGGLNNYPCCEDYLQLGEILYAAHINDVPNSAETVSYIIEWSADCNADGIIDYGQILDGTFDDANANGIPDCCEGGASCAPCQGDLTGDGTVDGADLTVLITAWGPSGKAASPADMNGDGFVNSADLSLLFSQWGVCSN